MTFALVLLKVDAWARFLVASSLGFEVFSTIPSVPAKKSTNVSKLVTFDEDSVSWSMRGSQEHQIMDKTITYNILSNLKWNK